LEKLYDNALRLNEMSPLALAFVGDGVYDLFVREYMIAKGNCPVKKLHSRTVELVNCRAQSRFLELLQPHLSEPEADICRRGRNARVGHVPKNADIADYHNATALESLFGYLYLGGQMERLRTLFDLIRNSFEEGNYDEK